MLETKGMRVLRAWLIWVAILATGPVYCLVTLVMAWQFGESVLEWRGFLQQPLPVGLPLAMACTGVVTPVLILLFRQFTRGIRERLAPSFEVPGDAERPKFERWMRIELIFAALASLPLDAALLLALLFGPLPVLWVATVEHVFLMLVYFPKRREIEGLA